jgi:hypothetical protein
LHAHSFPGSDLGYQFKEAVARKPQLTADLRGVLSKHLEVTNVLYNTEVCFVAMVSHKQSGESYLMKNWGIARVVQDKRANQV